MSKKKPVSLLKQALALREFFSDPNRWIKGTLYTGLRPEESCGFCLIGGGCHVLKGMGIDVGYGQNSFTGTELGKLLGSTAILMGVLELWESFQIPKKLSNGDFGESTWKFNDHATTDHETILALLDLVVLQARRAGV